MDTIRRAPVDVQPCDDLATSAEVILLCFPTVSFLFMKAPSSNQRVPGSSFLPGTDSPQIITWRIVREKNHHQVAQKLRNSRWMNSESVGEWGQLTQVASWSKY